MNLNEQIEKTAHELAPMYAHVEEDRPDRPLWDCPEINQSQSNSPICFAVASIGA